jgi:hypothetical protein
MTPTSVQGELVIEQRHGDSQSADHTERSLRLRIRQQELLVELGVLALQGTKFNELLNHAVRLTGEGLVASMLAGALSASQATIEGGNLRNREWYLTNPNRARVVASAE